MNFFLGDLGESVKNIKVLGEPTEVTNKVGRFQGKPVHDLKSTVAAIFFSPQKFFSVTL